jgi:hypothetical protein
VEQESNGADEQWNRVNRKAEQHWIRIGRRAVHVEQRSRGAGEQSAEQRSRGAEE